MQLIFGMLIGFVAGLFYSRGRLDPVADARAHVVDLWRKMTAALKELFKTSPRGTE